MRVTKKSFILVEEPGSTFTINEYLERLLRKKMQPILWHRNGMFCVVPVEVLQNALDSADIYKKLGMANPSVKIDWKQAFPFPDGRAAAILAGLEY